MKKSLVLAIAVLLLGLCWGQSMAEEKVLDTPNLKPGYYESVQIDHVGWHPRIKQFSIRLTLGYNDDGTWVETADDHIVVKNIPDNPETPEDEADLAYDNFLALLKFTDLTETSPEKLVLDRFGGDYIGTIQ